MPARVGTGEYRKQVRDERPGLCTIERRQEIMVVGRAHPDRFHGDTRPIADGLRRDGSISGPLIEGHDLIKRTAGVGHLWGESAAGCVVARYGRIPSAFGT